MFGRVPGGPELGLLHQEPRAAQTSKATLSAPFSSASIFALAARLKSLGIRLVSSLPCFVSKGVVEGLYMTIMGVEVDSEGAQIIGFVAPN